RARLSRRLSRDLEIDMAGAALAVDLLERLRGFQP
nr:MerR family transcriptional regulator [Acidithiobacillus ferridurans]